MTRLPLRLSLTLSLLLLHGCTDDDPVPRLGIDGGLVATDGGTETGKLGANFVLPPDCAPIGNPLPKTLSCTGLYGAAGTAPVEKALHPTNREFAPGAQLWTDGAEKRRWIALPEGTQIDTSNPNGWVFPNGTRIWKEFAFKGKRAETRFMFKTEDAWTFATYQWNETDTEAVAVDGAEVPLVGGGAHTIPTLLQCNECHRGARDKVLGFQQVLLGLPTATGLTLGTLMAESRLSVPPARTTYAIPDDGTGMSAQALSWIHVNCGVSCHNETGNAIANMSKMFLRIDPAKLDVPTTEWDIVKLTVGVPTVTPNFFGGVRIVPGSPDDSVLVQLAQTRGSNRAMPPLGTRIVDPNGLAIVRDWIARLGGRMPTPDAGIDIDSGLGVDAAVQDAGVDAAPAIDDAASSDPALVDAELVDADVPDALPPEVPVTELPDAQAPPVVEPAPL